MGDGIRVHLISPGGVDTELAASMRPDLDRSGLTSPAEVAESSSSSGRRGTRSSTK
jgi:NAD(P)-dependent dehydrogenase (short-subunit alcohol dehydrogenase family)